jgi:hypothetical protein
MFGRGLGRLIRRREMNEAITGVDGCAVEHASRSASAQSTLSQIL